MYRKIERMGLKISKITFKNEYESYKTQGQEKEKGVKYKNYTFSDSMLGFKSKILSNHSWVFPFKRTNLIKKRDNYPSVKVRLCLSEISGNNTN